MVSRRRCLKHRAGNDLPNARRRYANICGDNMAAQRRCGLQQMGRLQCAKCHRNIGWDSPQIRAAISCDATGDVGCNHHACRRPKALQGGGEIGIQGTGEARAEDRIDNHRSRVDPCQILDLAAPLPCGPLGHIGCWG